MVKYRKLIRQQVEAVFGELQDGLICEWELVPRITRRLAALNAKIGPELRRLTEKRVAKHARSA